MNLTSISTSQVENPKSTIIRNIAQKTEEINAIVDFVVTMIGLSHIKIEEEIITFFIYLSLDNLNEVSKGLKFPVELTYRRVLRILQVQEAICELIEDAVKGDLYIYSCEIQATSNQIVKNTKIYNQFRFSSQNNSIGVSCSPLMEQYMDNIQEIGNKMDYLIDSTLYTLKNPKIYQAENQIFNISGTINDPKPKFGKIDLNLTASVEYQNKNEERQLECSIIDIIENNYTLNCIGIKNANFSLKNAMSVIDNEILLITFSEKDNTTIYYYSEENKNIYTRGFNSNKKGKIGTGGIIGIIFACLAVVAAIITFICFKKANNKSQNQNSDNTIANLNISN